MLLGLNDRETVSAVGLAVAKYLEEKVPALIEKKLQERFDKEVEAVIKAAVKNEIRRVLGQMAGLAS